MSLSPTAQQLVSSYLKGLKPSPILTVSQWADQNRILGSNSPEPGLWRTSRVPYMREIMDNLSQHSGVEETILMKAAQGAGTEGALNFAAYVMARGAGDMLIVLPTTVVARTYSRKRLSPMIESCPALRNSVTEAEGSNTMLLMEYMGGSVRITGANSAAGLRSDPVPNLLMDEEDGYPFDLKGEGSPSELALQRVAAFRNRRIFRISTPTLEGFSSIAIAYRSSDQRKYFIECPRCRFSQQLFLRLDVRESLDLGGLIWSPEDPSDARYQCSRCHDTFVEHEKNIPLQNGIWIPQAPGNGGPKRRSYQINALYYPYGFPGNAWPSLAAQIVRDGRDPVKIKTFVNLKMGEPYSDPTDARVDGHALLIRREHYTTERVPVGVAGIFAGVDVQGTRLEVLVLGVGVGEESWVLEYRVFPGDSSKLSGPNSPWPTLDSFLKTLYRSEILGTVLPIKAVCIDSGYNTQQVTEFCGERLQRRIFATKGLHGPQRSIWPVSRVATSPTKFPAPKGIGVDSAKGVIYSRLVLAEPGPGYIHLPAANIIDAEWCEQLTSEVRIPDYSRPQSTYRWEKKTPGARNEVLDTMVYAYAAYLGQRDSYAMDLAGEHASMVLRANAMRREEETARVVGTSQSAVPAVTTQRDMSALYKPIRKESYDD